MNKELKKLKAAELVANLAMNGVEPKRTVAENVADLDALLGRHELELVVLDEEKLAASPLLAQAGFEAGMRLVVVTRNVPDAPVVDNRVPTALEAELEPPVVVSEEFGHLGRPLPENKVLSAVEVERDGRTFVEVRVADGRQYRLTPEDFKLKHNK